MATTAAEQAKTRSDLAQLAGMGPFSLFATLGGVLVGYAMSALLIAGAAAVLQHNDSSIDLTQPWDSARNKQFSDTPVKQFQSVHDPQPGVATPYGARCTVRVDSSTRTTTGSGARSGSSETTGKASVKAKAGDTGASGASSQQGESSPKR